jgi:hypothetical protein
MKYKILKDKHGWYYQERDADICALISALNALKFYNKRLSKNKINKLYKNFYNIKELGLGAQQFLCLLIHMQFQFEIGHFDINYIKCILHQKGVIILDSLEQYNKDYVYTHMFCITKYKMKNNKYYLFCTNNSEKGSIWVPWNKIKKFYNSYNNKKLIDNFCVAITGIL